MNNNILKVSTNEDGVSIFLNKTPIIQTFQTKSNGDLYNIKISIEMDESRKQKDEYYISVDYGMNNSTKATLFHKDNKGLKIIKFITINGNTVDRIAESLIDEINPYRNGKILIENIGCGRYLIDQIESKGFNNIIKLDPKDINASKINNTNLIRNNEKMYKLMSEDIKQNTQQLIEFIELVKELNNVEIRMGQGNIIFVKKSKEIDSSRIQTVFQILSKLIYLL